MRTPIHDGAHRAGSCGPAAHTRSVAVPGPGIPNTSIPGTRRIALHRFSIHSIDQATIKNYVGITVCTRTIVHSYIVPEARTVASSVVLRIENLLVRRVGMIRYIYLRGYYRYTFIIMLIGLYYEALWGLGYGTAVPVPGIYNCKGIFPTVPAPVPGNVNLLVIPVYTTVPVPGTGTVRTLRVGTTRPSLLL